MEPLDLYALAQSSEPLRDELKPYVRELDGMTILQHPLVYSVPMFSAALSNRMYEHKLEALKQAEENCDLNTAIYLHERPYRLDALQRYADSFETEDEYWAALRSVWVDSENIYQNRDTWEELWDEVTPQVRRAVHPEEESWEAFNALPAEVVIYRGYAHEDSREGLSWTTDKEKAEWFARRHRNMTIDVDEPLEAILISGMVKKQDVLAYILDRGENEIVARFGDITITDMNVLE